MPAAYSLIADKFPVKRMTTAMSIFGMGPKLGSAFAFAVGSAVIGYTSTVGNVSVPVFGDLNGWRLALLLIGAPGLLVALLCFSFREPLRKGMQRSHSNTGSLADTAATNRHSRNMSKRTRSWFSSSSWASASPPWRSQGCWRGCPLTSPASLAWAPRSTVRF